jgi:hypothetical protein
MRVSDLHVGQELIVSFLSAPGVMRIASIHHGTGGLTTITLNTGNAVIVLATDRSLTVWQGRPVVS